MIYDKTLDPLINKLNALDTVARRAETEHLGLLEAHEAALFRINDLEQVIGGLRRALVKVTSRVRDRQMADPAILTGRPGLHVRREREEAAIRYGHTWDAWAVYVVLQGDEGGARGVATIPEDWTERGARVGMGQEVGHA